MTLYEAKIGQNYRIKDIPLQDIELKHFLSTLGCLRGGTINVVSKKSMGLMVMIKDVKYNMDKQLSKLIEVEVL